MGGRGRDAGRGRGGGPGPPAGRTGRGRAVPGRDHRPHPCAVVRHRAGGGRARGRPRGRGADDRGGRDRTVARGDDRRTGGTLFALWPPRGRRHGGRGGVDARRAGGAARGGGSASGRGVGGAACLGGRPCHGPPARAPRSARPGRSGARVGADDPAGWGEAAAEFASLGLIPAAAYAGSAGGRAAGASVGRRHRCAFTSRGSRRPARSARADRGATSARCRSSTGIRRLAERARMDLPQRPCSRPRSWPCPAAPRRHP